MNDYIIYCTKEQTKRAYALGAPICEHGMYHEDLRLVNMDGAFFEIPTAQQMIGWLRNKDIDVKIIHLIVTRCYECEVLYCLTNLLHKRYKTYEQAELAAIDAALDYLEKGFNK